MNMKSFNKIEEIKNKFRSLINEQNEEEEIKHDAYILMAGYLSEIEQIQEIENLQRKDLASKIKISASYLTQVFRGDKPLNFYTLAKIQKALKIKFKVKAVPLINKSVDIKTYQADFSNYKTLQSNYLHTNLSAIKGGQSYGIKKLCVND